MAGIVGGSPCAAAMGVGAITDALCRLWSRLRAHEWPTRIRGGVLHRSEIQVRYICFKVIRTIFFELCVSLVMILDRPIHQESTENPEKGPLSYPIAAQRAIKDRRTGCVVQESKQRKSSGSSWSPVQHTGPAPIRCKKLPGGVTVMVPGLHRTLFLLSPALH